MVDEVCQNPWKPDCKNSDIIVEIMYKGEPHPICRECWKEINDLDKQWSSEPETSKTSET